MNYKGDLYGKANGITFKLLHTTDQFDRMHEALKWFVNAMSDGSLIVFTDDDQHKAVRDDNQDHINEIEALVKSLE